MLAARPEISFEEHFAPLDSAKTRFVSKVYNGLTLSLAISAIACVVAYQMFQRMPQSQVWATWSVLRFVTLGMMIFTLFVRLTGIAGWLWLLAFVTLMGVTLAPVIMIYMNPAFGGPATIAAALALTAVIFLTLSAYVRFSGKDFAFLGGFLWMATIGLILVGLLTMFFPMPNVSYWRAWIGAAVFCGWILYDTAAVTRQYYHSNDVVGAILALFVDIFNLFLFLLQILSGGRRRD